MRMTDEVYDEQKGKNLVAYVNDIIVKSDKKDTHIKDLQETFQNLAKNGLKLNPENYILGIKKGNCLVVWYRQGASRRTQKR